jgi:hypothetical protein
MAVGASGTQPEAENIGGWRRFAERLSASVADLTKCPQEILISS